jgi:excisionase family DNA binding protein
MDVLCRDQRPFVEDISVNSLRPEITGRSRAAYSIAEVMALTGLGHDSVYKAIRAGHLPARKLGRRTLVLATDLQRFLEALPVMGAAR